ncbi:MAG: hypothetical protein ACOVVP_15380, partial [Pseudanabaena sp.]
MKAARSAAFIYLGFCPSYLKKTNKNPKSKWGGGGPPPLFLGFFFKKNMLLKYNFKIKKKQKI